MDDQNKNLILATALSFMVIMVWFILFPPEEPVQAPEPGAVITDSNGQIVADAGSAPEAPGDDIAVPTADDVRIAVKTPELEGSILLKGGRIDDLYLLGHKETLDPDSPNVSLLRPKGDPESFYATFGWARSARSPELMAEDIPDENTIWGIEGGEDTVLTPTSPITLVWTNTKGMTFRRQISVDDRFMFTISQSVTNNGSNAVLLAPFNAVVREGLPSNLTRLLVHEGAIRQSGEEMQETSFRGGFMQYPGFDEMDPVEGWGPHADVTEVTQNGWLGFTDHYWMSILIPAADQPFRAVVQYLPLSQTYRTSALYRTLTVDPGQTVEVTSRLFAGAKEWDAIRHYENDGNVYRLSDSTDWGWYFFLTKPMFRLLNWLYLAIGNMGWAIIGLTLLIKAILFPLAYKSYVSMAKMKELQPEMEKIKERVGDDRQKLQQEMMALYKKEKVNPASGCLPILLQIPIFFSLYKVILVTLELRHAPWIGWIRDLSAPDPSSILNLWGILPFAGPEPGSLVALIFIGILPLCLGVSMWLQQKLNPAPTDPTQQMIFAWMPWVFMFMLGSFASGLVIYWIANNVITFTQQYIIMRSQGYTPDVFGNIRSSFKRKDAPKK